MSLVNEPDFWLLTPLAVTKLNELLYKYIWDDVKALQSEKDISKLPSQYSGENEKELFAELFAVNALRRINVKNYEYKDIDPSILSNFRTIAGIKEKSRFILSKGHIVEGHLLKKGATIEL